MNTRQHTKKSITNEKPRSQLFIERWLEAVVDNDHNVIKTNRKPTTIEIIIVITIIMQTEASPKNSQ